jgi:hypothetical protein
MNNRYIRFGYAAIFSLFGAIGCSASGVQVPEIPDSVPMEDYCKLLNQIACAGAMGCCTDRTTTYSSQEACEKANLCESSLGLIFASNEMATGVLKYDAAKAATQLRQKAEYTKACGTIKQSNNLQPFLIGTKAIGADCSANADDVASAYTCQPGLRCTLSDPELLPDARTCMASPSTVSVGQRNGYGEACATNEDCRTGLCQNGTCAVDTNKSFCVPIEKPTTPSNSAAVLQSLTVYCPYGDVSIETNARIYVHVIYGAVSKTGKKRKYYGYFNGLARGDARVVTLSYDSDVTASTETVQLVNKTDDGVSITALKLNFSDGSDQVVEDFYASDACDCDDIGPFDGVDSCWIDAVGHGSNQRLIWTISGKSVDCTPT